MHNLLLAATETAQQLKRSAGVPFHAKGRGLLRKMDTTSKAVPLLCSGSRSDLQSCRRPWLLGWLKVQSYLSLIGHEGLI